jgi:Flp pilus assembly protein protease CpaA
MNPSIIRLIGIVLLVAAAVTAILNLHRVADLKMPWLAPLLLVLGIGLVVFARRRQG